MEFKVFPQENIFERVNQSINIPPGLISKIGSGELLRIIQHKIKLNSEQTSKKDFKKEDNANQFINLIIYLSQNPSSYQKSELSSLTSDFNGLLVPPAENHPFGFFIAKVPLKNLTKILTLDFVKIIETADDLSFPQNNEAAKKIKADYIWGKGYSGCGVKIAVLDSGLDTTFAGTEFPAYIYKEDYSDYPSLDTDIANKITGHGTHVTGSVLARGILSENNTANGQGPYKGIAPDAELIFIKIGNDINGGANTTAIVEGLKAAVTIYDADIITMSYGNWDIYHDGSNIKDQTVDWCYEQGVPVFIPAGNNGASKRHYSGFVEALDSTDLIKINVTDALEGSTYLTFNLVWYDGTERNDLNLKYYNELGEEIPNIYYWTTTQSLRGTESKLSQGLFQVPAGNSVYYLKVINRSSSRQQFHIYEHNNDGKVRFEDDDPSCTIISPGTADHAFTVGSFVSRTEWTSYNGLLNCSSENQLENIYSYSSRGPRIDGYQKPDLVAPGSSIISLRDGDVYNTPNIFFVDNDGNTSGDYNYLVMEGTSMSAPFCAGAAALYLEKNPEAGPGEVYNALRNNTHKDEYTGIIPNQTFGYGKLDTYSALFPSDPLPTQLTTFTAEVKNNFIELKWSTSTEMNNYGFEVERKFNKESEFLSESLKIKSEEWKFIGFVGGSGTSNSQHTYTLTDKNLFMSGEYSYRIKQIDLDGSSNYSSEIKISYNLPRRFELTQNYPNPFNPSTKIRYIIPFSETNSLSVPVILKIYDIIGREICTLVNENQEPGVYEIEFNPENLMPGNPLASGVYFYKLTVGSYSASKKMVYIQ